MPNYRRALAPGGTFFFTLVTFNRSPFLLNDLARDTRHTAIAECQQRWPFELDAIVFLPDHLHAMWTLPPGDSDYSRRWGWLKKTFTQRYLCAGGIDSPVSPGKRRDGRRGIWQPKFWEHTIRDQDDLSKHLDYIHYNPVKHDYVRCPHQWPYSSFPKWVRREVYAPNWQCACGDFTPTPPSFDGLPVDEME